MIFIGIDAAKDKHDCFIVSSEGEVLCDVFTISNTLDGFNDLLSKIKSFSKSQFQVLCKPSLWCRIEIH